MQQEVIQKLEGKVIKNLNPEFGKEMIDFYKSVGVDTKTIEGLNFHPSNICYYGIHNGAFNNFTIDYVRKYNIQIITLAEAGALVANGNTTANGNQYPKVMRVSNAPFSKNCNGLERTVRMEIFVKEDKFYVSMEDRDTYPACWKYAADLPPTNAEHEDLKKKIAEMEVNLNELAKTLNELKSKVK